MKSHRHQSSATLRRVDLYHKQSLRFRRITHPSSERSTVRETRRWSFGLESAEAAL